jgi:hypothetical protein
MNTTATIKEQISVERLRHIVDRVAIDNSLAPDSYNTLIGGVDQLESIYGTTMNKALALRLLSEQFQLTKTGLIRDPVDVVEFVESPEYMDQGAYVRPRVMEHLYNLFKDENKYYEVVLGGALGWGKNYFCDMAMAYLIYKLSCLYSPQVHYGLSPGSDIIFVLQSKRLELARGVMFNQFAARIQVCKYFRKYFPPSSTFSAQLRFPHNISVFPVSSSDTAVIGRNVIVAALDELNFMLKTKRTTKQIHADDGIYDQAEVLYKTVLGRITSRYESMGRLLGKIFLISSANYEDDFIDKKEKEAKALGENSYIYVAHMSRWDVEYPNRLLPGRFYIKLPTENTQGRILDDKPEDMEGILEVPENYRHVFEQDLDDALRNFGGVVSKRVGRFIMGEYIEKAFKGYKSIYGNEQIFNKSIVELNNQFDLEQLVNTSFLRSIADKGPFGAHCDLAKSDRSVGISICHVAGARDIGARVLFDPKKGEFIRKVYGKLPIYSLVGLLSVAPSVDSEIDINAVRDLLFLIAEYIPLKFVNFDWYQSTAFIQSFRARKIASKEVSVVRKPSAYLEFKNALKEERLLAPYHEILKEELRHLEHDKSTDEIVGRSGHSKDLSDASAAVVWEFSDLRSSYRKKHKPEKITEPKKVTSGRPSSGRESIYGW